MDRSPDFDALPLHVDRERGAALITEFYFPVSPRSLERWPIATRRLNGRAIMGHAVRLANYFDVDIRTPCGPPNTADRSLWRDIASDHRIIG